MAETKDETGEKCVTIQKPTCRRSICLSCGEQMNTEAVGALPDAYHVRNCRRDELDVWMRMRFDDPCEAEKVQEFKTSYFSKVHGSKKDLFFEPCLFVCGKRDNPIGTAFIWKVYEQFV
jgi:hypothetical protein